jgi:hypothetical protein
MEVTCSSKTSVDSHQSIVLYCRERTLPKNHREHPKSYTYKISVKCRWSNMTCLLYSMYLGKVLIVIDCMKFSRDTSDYYVLKRKSKMHMRTVYKVLFFCTQSWTLWCMHLSSRQSIHLLVTAIRKENKSARSFLKNLGNQLSLVCACRPLGHVYLSNICATNKLLDIKCYISAERLTQYTIVTHCN